MQHEAASGSRGVTGSKRSETGAMQLEAPHLPFGVLIIDDDPIVFETVSAMLGEMNRPVIHASSHAEAERAVEGGFRGVILLDLGLPEDTGRPERNGLLLVEPLRRRAPANPIIVMTSKNDLP